MNPPPSRAMMALILVVLVASGCRPQPAQEPTPAPTVKAAMAIATNVTLPASTSIATPTPTAIVSFTGPKLVYRSTTGGIYLMSFDGTGKQRLALPAGYEIQSLDKAASPDGKWLAFHTGSEINKDIALNLLSLETGETVLVTRLLSPDYPDNFDKALARIQASPTDFFQKSEITADTLRSGFDLTQVSWSPDGRFLAFAGEMDGPTSDLYLYDTEGKTITRMFDDLLNLGFLDWSSDGKVIYYSDIIPGQIYTWDAYYAVNIDNGHIQRLRLPGWSDIKLCFESKFCVWSSHGDGGDPFNISYLDVSNGKIRALWKPTFQDYAVAPAHKLIVVSGPYGDELPPGTYFVDFAGKRKKISDLFFERFTFWEAEEPSFLGTVPEGLYRISLDGTVQKVADGAYYEYSISPDGKWLIAYNSQHLDYGTRGFLLLDNKLEVVHTFDEPRRADPAWQPDSSGFFIVSQDLYHVSIPDDQLQILEKDTNVSFAENDYRWIP